MALVECLADILDKDTAPKVRLRFYTDLSQVLRRIEKWSDGALERSTALQTAVTAMLAEVSEMHKGKAAGSKVLEAIHTWAIFKQPVLSMTYLSLQHAADEDECSILTHRSLLALRRPRQIIS